MMQMDVSTPPSLDLACPQAKTEIEKYVHMFRERCVDKNKILSVENDTYGITRIPTTVSRAWGCEKSRSNRKHTDRLPRFGLRGCVKP